MATAIFNQFLTLSNASQQGSNSYNVIQLSGLPHFLGVSPDGYPMFFVECSNNAQATNISLDSFSVKFNCSCTLTNSATRVTSQGVFSIFTFENGQNTMKEYFIEIFYNVLNNHLPSHPKVAELQNEIFELINLFKDSPNFSEATVQGLWAELFIIAQSKDPLYMVKSWHVNSNDKYDFNDGNGKIEVKSSSKMQHVHAFSWEQLNPLPGMEVVVVSIFVNSVGIGKNIFDLESVITNKLTDANAINKVRKQIIHTIGKKFMDAQNYYYDEKTAKSSLSLYRTIDIPSIVSTSIPSEIKKIHFEEDLSGVQTVSKNSLSGKLFLSL